jgi:hypothetical protein
MRGCGSALGAARPPRASSARVGDATSCQREPIASRRSGAYLRASTRVRHGTGLFVLTLTNDRGCAFTRFDNSVLLMVRAAAVAPKPTTPPLS